MILIDGRSLHARYGDAWWEPRRQGRTGPPSNLPRYLRALTEAERAVYRLYRRKKFAVTEALAAAIRECARCR